MPLTAGRYAEGPYRRGARWRWLRFNIGLTVARWRMPRSRGYDLHREWGAWVVRPASGWRSWRWITPAVHTTRSIPGHAQDAAMEWTMDRLGI